MKLIEETKQFFHKNFKLKEYSLVCYEYEKGAIAEIHCNCNPLISQESMQFFTDNYAFFHCKRIKPLFAKEKIVMIFYENIKCLKLNV